MANNRIFVSNFPFNTSERELEEIFSQHGTVSRIHLCKDKTTGAPRGFGFVTMAHQQDAETAIDRLNGVIVGGRPIGVQEAREPE